MVRAAHKQEVVIVPLEVQLNESGKPFEKAEFVPNSVKTESILMRGANTKYKYEIEYERTQAMEGAWRSGRSGQRRVRQARR